VDFFLCCLQGISLIYDLIEMYGLRVIQAYMGYIQTNAELAVREMLKEFGSRVAHRVCASDFMDDGSEIKLAIQIDAQDGSAVFDFRLVSACLHIFPRSI